MRFLGDDHFARPQMQSALVQYANTRRGRAGLCIRDDVPKNRSVIGMHRNRMTWLTHQEKPGLRNAMRQIHEARGPISLTTDFRCRSKFAYRLHALHVAGKLPFDVRSGYAMPARRRRLLYVPGLSVREAHALSSPATFYPDPNPETTSVDGYVYQTGADVAYATLRDGAGGAAYDTNTWQQAVTLRGGVSSGWRWLARSLFLFDTSGMEDGATISLATMSLYAWGTFDQSCISGTELGINIYAAAPASNTGLVAGDYDSLGTAAYSDSISMSDWTAETYEAFVLNSSGLAAISDTGVSKFGARDPVYDAPDGAPTRGYLGSGWEHIFTYFADETGTSKDPKLVVTFTIGPPSGSLGLTGIGV